MTASALLEGQRQGASIGAPSHFIGYNRDMDERETVVGALRQAFESEPEVVFAYLFGSLAAGGFGPSSDIDVAVMISGVAPSMRKRLSLHHRLAKSFNREIDLVILNDARSFELRCNRCNH